MSPTMRASVFSNQGILQPPYNLRRFAGNSKGSAWPVRLLPLPETEAANTFFENVMVGGLS
jgi:hypothetical protein